MENSFSSHFSHNFRIAFVPILWYNILHPPYRPCYLRILICIYHLSLSNSLTLLDTLNIWLLHVGIQGTLWSHDHTIIFPELIISLIQAITNHTWFIYCFKLFMDLLLVILFLKILIELIHVCEYLLR